MKIDDFFENKGTILQFDKNSKLIWKKIIILNRKKLNPILQFANNENISLLQIILQNLSLRFKIRKFNLVKK